MAASDVLTISKLIYNLRNLIRDNRSDDIKITDRQLEFIINYYRARLIKQELDKNRSISSSIVQDLGIIPLTLVDSSEVNGIASSKKILKTSSPIPKPLELNQKDAIIYVGGIDKSSSIDFVTKAQARWNKFSKYGSKLPTAYYRNGYMYIVDSPQSLKYINIEGIFANPREVTSFKAAGQPNFDIDQDPYPISEYMVSALSQMIVSSELTFFLQMTPDEVNNANDQIVNSTQLGAKEQR